MKVTLLDVDNSDLCYQTTENEYIHKMYTAARTCYSADTIDELYHNDPTSVEDEWKLVQKVLASGHQSIAEHVIFTFGIDQVSRSLTHQLVRHRLCTFSQQSQRYTNFSDKCFHYVTPPSIEQNESLNKEYDLIMEQLKNFYDRAVNAGIKPEDARFVLPNAATTNITVSTNLRNLMHIMNLRLCNRAQWEIRAVFVEMKKQIKMYFPKLSTLLVPSCEIYGFCLEGQCCGKKPSKKQMQEALNNYKPE